MRSITLLLVLCSFLAAGQIRNGDLENFTVSSSGHMNPDHWLDCSVHVDSNAYSGQVAAAVSQFCQGIESGPGGLEQWVSKSDSSTLDSSGAIYMYLNIERSADPSSFFGVYIDAYGGLPRENATAHIYLRPSNGYFLWWAPYSFSYRPDSLHLFITNGNSSFVGGGGITDTVLVDSIYLGEFRPPHPFNTEVNPRPISVDVFPNPAKRYITWDISYPEHLWRVELINGQGAVLKALRKPIARVDLDDVPPGMYVLRFIFKDGRTVIERFIRSAPN